MDIEYYLGVDVGPEGRTTCVMMEKKQDENEETAAYDAQAVHEYDPDEPTAIASCIQSVIADSPYTGRVSVVVNDTERAGRQLVSELAKIGLTPVGIALATGDGATQQAPGLAGTQVDSDADTSGFFVSEEELLETISDLHQTGLLEVPQGTDALQQLADGMYGEATLERSAEQSRFLIAGAMACWFGEQRSFDSTQGLGGWQPTTGEASAKRRWTSTS